MATPTLDEFLGKLVGDLGAALSAALVGIGDKLGLYKALAGTGGLTPAALAQKTHTDERYVHEWLSAQAAAGYVDYDPGSGTFCLNEVQTLAFADESSPAHFLGGFQVTRSMYKDLDKIVDAFKSGKGVGWHEHDADLFCGTERFFRTGYNANLVPAWIPALEGVDAKLRKGASVADVGCGHGASTIVMAQAYPASTFTGFDYHEPSIVAAREAAGKASLGEVIKASRLLYSQRIAEARTAVEELVKKSPDVPDASARSNALCRSAGENETCAHHPTAHPAAKVKNTTGMSRPRLGGFLLIP